MIVKIMSYFYYNNKDEDEEFNAPVLCWCCRDEEKNFHLVQILDKENLAPMFGILKEDRHIVEGLSNVVRIEEGPNSLYEEETLRVYTTFPWEVRNIRNEYFKEKLTFQADVKWEKMSMSKILNTTDIDSPYVEIPDDYMYKYLKVGDLQNVPEKQRFYIDRRICYWDIETDSRDMPHKVEYEHFEKIPIVSITTFDSYDKEYHQFVWHPEFKKTHEYELTEYEIADNVLPDQSNIIKKNVRHEYLSEKEMLKGFFEYVGATKFDVIWGFFSEGGWKKQGGRRIWVNGFDMPCTYARADKLKLLEEMQKMSPCPKIRKKSGRLEAVYLRNYKGKTQVVIKGVGQLDYVFTDSVIDFARKHYDFRGSKLADWMSFFLGYNKLDKDERQVWEYWLQKDIQQYSIEIDKVIEEDLKIG